jgi:hypothetical protein
MNEEHKDSGLFRQGIGLLCIVGGLSALAGLYFIDVPAGNKEPLLLAIGIVLGWGGSVVNSEYGATTTGRKVAEAAVRQVERQTIANEQPAVPADAIAAADQTAEAAVAKADEIKRNV